MDIFPFWFVLKYEDRKIGLSNTGKTGNREKIFSELLSHRESVFLICMGYTKDFEEAEELTQDIYVRAWEKLDYIRDINSVKGWLITIARNRCIDNIRKIKVRNFFIKDKWVSDNETKTDITPEQKTVLDDDRKRLKKCILSLPEKFRSVFILKEYSGYSREKISEILGLKLGTVHSRLNRARERIIREMEALNG